MTSQPTFDLPAAHRYFSVECFNRAWDRIDKSERTPAEDEEMLQLALVSLWHWLQRTDCTSENRSVGLWQVARVYALLGQAENARRYAQFCLDASQGADVPPYCLGYAYEALARAEMVAGDRETTANLVQKAQLVAEDMQDLEAKQMLLKDLETIEPR